MFAFSCLKNNNNKKKLFTYDEFVIQYNMQMIC